MKKSVLAAILILACAGRSSAQPAADDIRELKLRDWQPRSMMVTKTTIVEQPMFPVIDVHNHLGSVGDALLMDLKHHLGSVGGVGDDKLMQFKQRSTLTPERVNKYLTEMDQSGVRLVVNLDGGWGESLQATIRLLEGTHPGRFLTFARINFEGIDDADWSRREARVLEESFQAGAGGLKFSKALGLHYRYQDGRIMPVDDVKLDPIWEVCAKYQRPVIIHVADPAAFFTPLDRFNERWHELINHPYWLFHGDRFLPRQQLLDQLHAVIAKHSKTTFINTHFGNNPEDLAAVGRNLDKYPNMHVDIDARVSELGRQPYTARKFFIKYQDRIMYGTDRAPDRERFRLYYRFLETDDEYFPCPPGPWMIYGIHLPREVLEKVYYTNAERVLGLGK